MQAEINIDFFAGAGGASTGIRNAIGREVDLAVNHWGAALEIHKLNHPTARHLIEDVFAVKPREVLRGRPMGFMWLSPDCKHFSKAKGGKPVDKRIRGLAWLAVKWAKEGRPRVIFLENVEEFRDWGPLIEKRKAPKPGPFPSYREWRKQIERAGGIDGRGFGADWAYPRKKYKTLKAEHEELRKAYSNDNQNIEMIPDPARRGQTYRQFCGRLRALGYAVEDRVLVAADYGAPTTRKRLFLIARRDRKSIVWPEPTHSKTGSADLFGGLKKWRSAAECIDWSLRCPSIFERKRPLAQNTLKRIAEGIRRYVIECKEPFIVPVSHAGGPARGHGVSDPLKTVTGAHRGEMGLVVPTVVGVGGRAGQSAPRGADEPLGTMTAKGDKAVAVAHIAQHYGESIGQDAKNPLNTVTKINHHTVVETRLKKVAPHITKFRGQSVGSGMDEPLPTITSGAGSARPAGAAHAMGVVAATLVQSGYGEREGQAPRALDPQEPLGTVVGTGKHAVAAPVLMRNNHGQKPCDSPEEPLRTVTTQGNKFGVASAVLVGCGGSEYAGKPKPLDEPANAVMTNDRRGMAAAFLEKMRGTGVGADPSQPMPTVTAGGQHLAEVRAFLVTYYGTGVGQKVRDPLRTITTKDRLGLVTIRGVEYQIVDIGLRMLTPRELARAQGFSEDYILPTNKSLAIALIGNSVCPPVAEAIVRANCPDLARQDAAA